MLPNDTIMRRCKMFGVITLEKFLTRNLELSEHHTVEEHLLQCTTCSSAINTYKQLQEEFIQQGIKKRIWNAIDHSLTNELPKKTYVSMFSAIHQYIQQYQKIMIPVFTLILFVFAFPFVYQIAKAPDDVTRIKGEYSPRMFSMSFLKKGKDNVIRYGISDDTVTPGEVIQISYTSSNEGYLMILGVLQDSEGNTHTEIYFPDIEKAEYENVYSEKISSGKNINIPYGLELDDILGDEKIIGIFSHEMFEFEDIADVLEHILNGNNPLSPQIYTSVIVLHKRSEL